MEREQQLHPIVEAAGLRGELPPWARCGNGRYAHAGRVATLLVSWAEVLALPETERTRWRAAGFLHDALKDGSPDELLGLAGPGWPGPVLHAPACAERLRGDGVADDELLLAIAYHPVGHPDFAALGEYLFMADFLDPGRRFLESERAKLRDRLPQERREVLLAVLAYRMEKLLRRRQGLLPASLQLWNRVVAS